MSRKMNFPILAIFTLIVSVTVMAQTPAPTPKTRTYTNKRGSAVTRTTSTNGNGTYQVNTQATGAAGKTATKSATYDTNASDGQVGRSKIVTGPQGKTRSVNANTTNNGDGSYTHNRDFKGFGGKTASRTATAGNGGYSASGTTRSGATYSRSRRR
ncbi:MAG TPA: hypothetical protein VJ810_01285 [Blastocatellia bacterium]|nr:hypothetical protein [Blastocatellia bacterium]